LARAQWAVRPLGDNLVTADPTLQPTAEAAMPVPVRPFRPLRAGAAALVALLGPTAALGQVARDYLYVENTLGGNVSVIEIPSHRVVGTIPHSVVGDHPDDVISTRDGSILYLSRLDDEEVIAISTETERLLWAVKVGGRPNHLTLSPDERLLYVPLFDKGLLVALDTRTREIVARANVGLGAHGTWLAPNGRSVYVGSIGSDQLTVVEVGGAHQVRKIIPLGEGVRPFQISPDEKLAYVQLSKLHGFVVVDLERDSVVKTISLPTLGKPLPKPTYQASHYVMNHGLGLSPDNRYLVANGSMSGFTAIYSHPGLELLGTVNVGSQPNWVVFSKDSRYAYVSNRADDTISVISLADRKETTRIKVGDYPQRMTVATVRRRPAASE
jgi:YVTN family beta-propeller protein